MSIANLAKMKIVELTRWLAVAVLMFASLWSWASPGDLDRSFGSEGTGFVDYTLFDAFTDHVPVALARDANGRIIVAGTCDYFFTILCVGRQLENGALDTTFGTQGRTYGFYNVSGFSVAQAQALATYDDGRIVVGGYCNGKSCFFRFQENGQIDSGFAVAVPSTGPNIPLVRALMVDGDKLVVLSRCGSQAGTATGCLNRYLESGAPDITALSLDGTGLQINPSEVIARDSVGRYLVGGRCAATGTVPVDVCIVRLFADGSYDLSFGVAGVSRITPSLPLVSDLPFSLAIDKQGRILTSGTCRRTLADSSTQDVFCVWRFNANGAIDVSFGSNGAVTIAANQQARNRASSIVVTSEGEVVVAGTCVDLVPSTIQSGVLEVNSSAQYCVAALSETGQNSTRFFGGSGRSVFQLTDSNARHLSGGAFGMTGDGRGHLIVAGIGYPGAGYLSSTLRTVVIRLFATQSRFDIDDDNSLLGGTDGVLVLRYLFGFRGAALVAGATGVGAKRIVGDHVAGYLNAVDSAHPNCSIDIAGAPGGPSATLDGLVLLRAMLGLTGDAVTSGIYFPPGTARTSWPDIRSHLVDHCGMLLSE